MPWGRVFSLAARDTPYHLTFSHSVVQSYYDTIIQSYKETIFEVCFGSTGYSHRSSLRDGAHHPNRGADSKPGAQRRATARRAVAHGAPVGGRTAGQLQHCGPRLPHPRRIGP